MTYFFHRGRALTTIVLPPVALQNQFQHFENAVRKDMEQYSISLLSAELRSRSTLHCALCGETSSKN